jgi:hypothetical protein
VHISALVVINGSCFVMILLCYFILGDFLLVFFSKQNELADKPDYNNYRLLLWKTMTEFPEICETKNRDISPLFLTFLE